MDTLRAVQNPGHAGDTVDATQELIYKRDVAQTKRQPVSLYPGPRIDVAST